MRAILLIPVLVLGGCVTLLPEPPPPPRTYVLEAQSVTELEAAPIDAVISVAEPGGERTLLGADLIWRTGDTIAYVDQSAWSNRAADSLQQIADVAPVPAAHLAIGQRQHGRLEALVPQLELVHARGRQDRARHAPKPS